MANRRTIRLTSKYDYYRGDARAERILGLSGDDDINGGDGNDIIRGGAGNDLIEGGRGNDRLFGGTGIDAVSYAGATGEVHVDLAQGYAIEFGENTRDTLSEFEVVIGSYFDDSIIGSNGNDDLRGGEGNDYISGGAGDDVLRGDGGNDILDGGDGFDTVDYFYSDGGTIDLTGPRTVIRNGGVDDLRNIEGVHGSRQDDIIIGSAVNNKLWGDAGNDTIDGGAGDDEIAGGRGKDVLTGGTGADLFVFLRYDTAIKLADADRITDFSSAEGDRIDLHAIDADVATRAEDAFHFIGRAAFSGTAGELRYTIRDGQTVIEADVTGDGRADGRLILDGVHALVAGDFVL